LAWLLGEKRELKSSLFACKGLVFIGEGVDEVERDGMGSSLKSGCQPIIPAY
jgi:hypothetical protein